MLWMRTQIRLAGQELIRRADLLELGGFDSLIKMDIHISIPTHRAQVELPSIMFFVDVSNKTHVDWLASGSDSYVGNGECETESDYVDKQKRHREEERGSHVHQCGGVG